MLARAIGLSGGRVVIGSGIPPGDELTRQVVTLIGGERENLAARDWLPRDHRCRLPMGFFPAAQPHVRCPRRGLGSPARSTWRYMARIFAP